MPLDEDMQRETIAITREAARDMVRERERFELLPFVDKARAKGLAFQSPYQGALAPMGGRGPIFGGFLPQTTGSPRAHPAPVVALISRP